PAVAQATVGLVQLMRPSLLIPGEAVGRVWTRDPIGKVRQPVGYFRARGTMEEDQYLTLAAMERSDPDTVAEIADLCSLLERMVRSVCRVTVGRADGRLYLLTAHAMEATGEGTTTLLVDLVQSGEITEGDAVRKFNLDEPQRGP